MTREELLRAVVDLVRRRDRALEDLNARALAATTVPGSPAAQEDSALLASLEAQRTSVVGLSTVVADLRVMRVPAEVKDRWPQACAVRLWRGQEAYTRLEHGQPRRVPRQVPKEVVLVLVPGPWRVAEVLAS